jgi:Initiator Replication protein
MVNRLQATLAGSMLWKRGVPKTKKFALRSVHDSNTFGWNPRSSSSTLLPRNRLLSVFASKYAIRLYAWAKDHLSVGTKRITLEELRTVLGLDPVKDTDGNVIREARLGAWANFRQRALNIAMAEINAKTDLNIALESLEQAEHQRVAALIFTIKARTVSKGKPSG